MRKGSCAQIAFLRPKEKASKYTVKENSITVSQIFLITLWLQTKTVRGHLENLLVIRPELTCGNPALSSYIDINIHLYLSVSLSVYINI